MYLLFCGETYYSSGGWKDFVGKFSSVEEAKDWLLRFFEKNGYDWYQIIDFESEKIVEEKDNYLND